MRRVLQVTECLSGGVPTFITRICEGLSNDFEFGVAAPTASVLLKSPPRGARIHPLEISHGIHPLRDLGAAQNLLRIVREGGYDVVHLNSTKAGVLGILTRGRLGVPSLFSPHALRSYAYPAGSFLNRAALVGERWICGSAGVVAAVSDEEASQMVAAGLASRSRVRVIENGVDLAALGSPGTVKRAALGIAEDAFVVGTVGRIAPQKDPETFVRAASLITRRVPAACFVVVGDGPMMEATRDLAAQLGVLDRMHFTGWRDDATEVLKLFDVFMMPSRYEGSPFTLFEAAAAGVPIVAADSPGVGGLIENGTTGLVVPQGNAHAFADAIVSLHDDGELAHRIAKSALREIAQRHSREVMLRSWGDLYRGCAVTPAAPDVLRHETDPVPRRSPGHD
jgi:glycosyltransferase involved in cell wall biosynthesis